MSAFPIHPRLVLSFALAGALSLSSTAQADIYTWVDANGRVNISNLAPPEDARVVGVQHEDADASARAEAARAAAQRADVQALSERVSQLEQQLDVAQRPMAPPVSAPAPAPVTIPVVIPYPVPQPAYAPVAQDTGYGYCDAWNCGLSWWYPFYPGVIVLSDHAFHDHDHRFPNRPFKPGRPVTPQPPMTAPLPGMTTPVNLFPGVRRG